MTLPENLKIRQMVAGDLVAVMAIERKADTAPHWKASDYLPLFQVDEASPFKRNAMVVEVANELAGFAIVRLVGRLGAAEAELESIVIAADWRGRGMGSLLLSESAREARKLGAIRMDLEVRASNAAAIRLYRGAGFLETGNRRAYYRDPEEDAVLMSVTL
jgi:[ribosomal protein S18]-alanine N-acetyltransferase